MPDLSALLQDADTIAIVGCSADPSRTSFAISRYLKQVGYRVIPVNPNYSTIQDEPCYPDLQSLPEGTYVDIVDIFRRSEHTADMVKMVIEYARSSGTSPAVWTQLGVSSPEAERLAEEAGLPYVRNRCIMVEHARLLGTRA